MSMDRLVELFVQSALEGGDVSGQGTMSQDAVEKGVVTVEKMLTSEDAAQMVGSPSATFVCLGMAMEDKQRLMPAAIRCYEKGLEWLDRGRKPQGSWERCVVLQQLGAVCLRQKRHGEAERWLAECVQACAQAEGHPRDAVLFSGSFSTPQTRLEFAAMVEKLRAKTYHEMGKNMEAHTHLAEAQRLEAAATGDAVERLESAPIGSADKPKSEEQNASRTVAANLWSETPAKEVRLKTYRYSDEGSTVLIVLDLNDHLGIGSEASDLVETVRQFRVRCENDSVDVQLRVRRESGEVWHFHLLLSPLRKEIVPEDTVPKLRGRPGKRRLEITLFKREKGERWFGDLVKDAPQKAASSTKAPAAEKGSLMNPLSAEELAKLPTPGGSNVDNRPSSYQASAPTPAAAPVPAPAQAARPPPEPEAAPRQGGAAVPAWVASVDERTAEGAVEFAVRIGESAGDAVSMQDLELDADAESSVLRLRLLQGSASGTLELKPPPGADVDALAAKWKRKTRTLELRVPLR